MKSPATATRGFTLIELLTVIAIIGILAAIIIPTTGAVRVAANKAQTKSQFNNWTTAMGLFKQEYSYYPDITNGANRLDSARFAGALTGRTLAGVAIPAGDAALRGNKKRLSFYTLTENDLNSVTAPTAIVDAFANTDIVVLYDRNGDGVINGTGPDESGNTVLAVGGLNPSPALTFPIRAPVVFYSAGRGSSTNDIIYSWK
jgi:prepilin-type N-terminal cleavage/methylation domain-containing protein